MSPVFKCSTRNHASSLEVLYTQQYLSPTLQCSNATIPIVLKFNTQLCLQSWSQQTHTQPCHTQPCPQFRRVQHTTMPYITMPAVLKCSTHNHAFSFKCSAYYNSIHNHASSFECSAYYNSIHNHVPVLKCSTHYSAIHNHASSVKVFNTLQCHKQPCLQCWSVQHITVPYTTMPPVFKCSTHNHVSSLEVLNT